MIIQLYKRKVAVFFGVMIFGVFTSTLAGCAQENDENVDASDQEISQSVPEQEAIQSTPEQEGLQSASFLDQDMVIGDVNAPVEIIEYASLTCNHCATFHNNVLPRIKEKYVDTGKVKIVMRSFLLNGIDVQASMISRCFNENRYFKFMDALYQRQMQWYNINEYQRLSGIHDAQTANTMFVEQTMDEISKIARQLGMNKNKIEACIANESIGEYLFSVQQIGVQQHKVEATPTIIVNGNKTNNDYASIEKEIEAALD